MGLDVCKGSTGLRQAAPHRARPHRKKGTPVDIVTDIPEQCLGGHRHPAGPDDYWIGVAPAGAPVCVTGTAAVDWKIVPPWLVPKNLAPPPAAGDAPAK